jgi:hypothetical protein
MAMVLLLKMHWLKISLATYRFQIGWKEERKKFFFSFQIFFSQNGNIYVSSSTFQLKASASINFISETPFYRFCVKFSETFSKNFKKNFLC